MSENGAFRSDRSGVDGSVRSYYGQPILKQPVWTPEIPFSFFSGGLAGASAGLAYLSERRGNDVLARRAWASALAGVVASPALLISDLGRPARFLNMLRMFKVTSPMSVGSWILSGAGGAIGVSALHAWTGRMAVPARAAGPAAALLGLPLATYTAALIADTAIPVWHEARGPLALLFAAGSAASAGGAALAATPPPYAAPARRLALGGVAAEVVAGRLMERRLGDLGEPYHEGAAGRLSGASRVLTAAGAALIGARAAGSRRAAVLGGALLAAGALCERWSVFRAGFQSAADPRYVVGPQRRRVEAARAGGALTTSGAGPAAGSRAAGG